MLGDNAEILRMRQILVGHKNKAIVKENGKNYERTQDILDVNRDPDVKIQPRENYNNDVAR